MSNKEQEAVWEKLLSDVRIGTKRSSQKDYGDRYCESPFENDKRRIVISSSFRRLQDKTQVFPLDRGDYVRTRLTHSIEVSALGATLGNAVAYELVKQKEITPEQGRYISQILECAGLIHDIGNPPFGHAGEKVIGNWYREHIPLLKFGGESLADLLTPQMKADFTEFEGNAQGLRIIGKLHDLKGDNGMHLTSAVMASMIKYPVSSERKDPLSDDIRKHKMGYYLTEEDLYREIAGLTGTRKGCRHPLAYLLEVADDVAYVTADIEDAVVNGLLTFKQVCREVGNLDSYVEKADGDEIKAVKNYLGYMRVALLYAARDTFIAQKDRIIKGSYKKEIMNPDDYGRFEELMRLKQLERSVYTKRDISSDERKGERAIKMLLGTYVPAILRTAEGKKRERDRKILEDISENYREKYEAALENAGDDKAMRAYLSIQLVNDHICGMTDHYVMEMYKKRK